MKIIRKASTLAVLLLPAVATADGKEYGASVSIGGGLVQFVQSTMTDYASDGPAWEGRIAFGTRKSVAVEVGYIGSRHAINMLGLDSDAHLLGTTVESALRFNILPGRLQPYVLAGVGWAYYNLTRTAATSDVSDHDNILVVPLGIGIRFKEHHWLFDARGVYRASELVDMFATDARLDSWSATLHLGFEY